MPRDIDEDGRLMADLRRMVDERWAILSGASDLADKQMRRNIEAYLIDVMQACGPDAGKLQALELALLAALSGIGMSVAAHAHGDPVEPESTADLKRRAIVLRTAARQSAILMAFCDNAIADPDWTSSNRTPLIFGRA